MLEPAGKGTGREGTREKGREKPKATERRQSWPPRRQQDSAAPLRARLTLFQWGRAVMRASRAASGEGKQRLIPPAPPRWQRWEKTPRCFHQTPSLSPKSRARGMCRLPFKRCRSTLLLVSQKIPHLFASKKAPKWVSCRWRLNVGGRLRINTCSQAREPRSSLWGLFFLAVWEEETRLQFRYWSACFGGKKGQF